MIQLSDFPAPDPMRSQEDADRFEGVDLRSETDPTLKRELAVLRVFNFFVDSEWHRWREQAIELELAARYRRRQKAGRS